MRDRRLLRKAALSSAPYASWSGLLGGWAVCAVVVLAGCGTDGATKYQGNAPTAEQAYGLCASCHLPIANRMLVSAPALRCETCHADATPNAYGPGHRTLPTQAQVPHFPDPSHAAGASGIFRQCAYCHDNFATNLVPYSDDFRCETCHVDQLLPTFSPEHRSLPGPELVPAFAGPQHALTPAQRGYGYCAFCHDDKVTNMIASDGDLTCQYCHRDKLSEEYGPDHQSIPGPELVPSFPGPAHALGAEKVYAECAYCHNHVTVDAVTTSGHGSQSLECEGCHTNLTPGQVGPGHRSITTCKQCHQGPRTHHDPLVGTAFECAICHTPHGSRNILLVQPVIDTPQGGPQAVVFTNLDGLADGSFASVSRPGSGVCEICHTATEFYRANGTGEPHYPYPCFTCHPHAVGFRPFADEALDATAPRAAHAKP